jgi:hypothetical protein
MASKFSELTKDLSPERRKRIEATKDFLPKENETVSDQQIHIKINLDGLRGQLARSLQARATVMGKNAATQKTRAPSPRSRPA